MFRRCSRSPGSYLRGVDNTQYLLMALTFNKVTSHSVAANGRLQKDIGQLLALPPVSGVCERPIELLTELPQNIQVGQFVPTHDWTVASSHSGEKLAD